jgi:hypothetical protein
MESPSQADSGDAREETEDEFTGVALDGGEREAGDVPVRESVERRDKS